MARGKNSRSLDTIASEIHGLERRNIFVIGKLLNEANEACEYGEWCEWLETEFEWSSTTADRYRAVATLAAETPRVGKLQLAPTTLYALTEIEEEVRPAVIDALAKRAAKECLKAVDAKEIIDLVLLRHEHGDLPDATLWALKNIERAHPSQASEALKSQAPTTGAEAEKIISGFHRNYVTSLFAPHGELPPIPDDALFWLEDVDEEHRARLLKRLLAAPQPLSEEDVEKIYLSRWRPDDDDPHAGDDKPHHGDDDDLADAGDAPEVPPTVSPREEMQPLVNAIKTILVFRDQVGELRDEARVVNALQGAGLKGVDLALAASFLTHSGKALVDHDAIKIKADRAEARSRANAAREAHASGNGGADHWAQLSKHNAEAVDRWIESDK